ncbi:MAG: hypothetical protein AB1643_00055 [Patescibacteria group bacterium]
MSFKKKDKKTRREIINIFVSISVERNAENKKPAIPNGEKINP